MSDNMFKSMTMQPQPVQPLPPGATSIGNAGFIKSQQQTDQLMALIGKSGGKRKRNRKVMKGGVPRIPVPAVPFNAPNGGTTANTYSDLAKLTAANAVNSTYDNAKTPAQTAAINTQQQSLYKSGGKRRTKKSRKGRKSRKSRKQKKY